MCSPTRWIHSFCCGWDFRPGCHGLWPLCGYLQPPALPGGGFSTDLPSPGGPYLHLQSDHSTDSLFLFSMSYCSSNVINHFYCDNVPLLALSCSDTYIPETAVFTFSGTNLFFSMIIVLTSYFNIILAILRIRSSEGRQKAFSTCPSHMMAVTVFYGTLLFMYLQPRTNHSLDTDKMASVFYTLVIPMLNPLIYSLSNKDVKDALKRFLDNPCQSFRLMQI